MKTKERRCNEVNLLELIPSRTGDFEEGEDGFVVLLAPRFRNRILRRLIEARISPQRRNFRIKLDDIGSAVWHLCDGKKTVREIAFVLIERFGERIENQCYERLGLFFQQLERGHFIQFENLEATGERERR